MAKWSKQKYKIKCGATYKEVEGAVNNIWGIDKRDNQYYILTHIPTGCFVESAKTQKFLKDLVEEPEFRDYESLLEQNQHFSQFLPLNCVHIQVDIVEDTFQ